MIELDGLKIDYRVIGEGEPIVFLHGWGVNKETFTELASHLNEYSCYLIDLPGFGGSDEPKSKFNLEYYVKIVRMFIEKQNIDLPIILGHSFGGRIAIRYAALYEVKSLVLVDSAGIKHRNFNYYWKVYTYKALKKLGIKIKGGSSDYQAASPIMKEVLKNVVSESLQDDLKQIKCKTLLIWGEKDSTTPIADAFTMEKLITDSGLVIIPNVGHFSYIEDFRYFSLVLDSFLSSDME